MPCRGRSTRHRERRFLSGPSIHPGPSASVSLRVSASRWTAALRPPRQEDRKAAPPATHPAPGGSAPRCHAVDAPRATESAVSSPALPSVPARLLPCLSASLRPAGRLRSGLRDRKTGRLLHRPRIQPGRLRSPMPCRGRSTRHRERRFPVAQKQARLGIFPCRACRPENGTQEGYSASSSAVSPS